MHVIVCLTLIAIVLIQSGRGGGLAESFSGAESIFGTKTNTFLTRATTVLAITFFITCLSLAFVSKQRSKSLFEGIKPPPVQTAQPKTAEEKQTEPQPQATEGKTAEPNKPAPQATEQGIVK